MFQYMLMAAASRPANWSITRLAAALFVTLFVSLLVALFSVPTLTTEGGLGRPVAGMSVLPDAGIVPSDPMTIVNLQQIYIDGSIGASRQVPIAGKTALGIEGEVAFTLASVLRTWGSVGGWSFASGITLPYVWSEVNGTVSAGPVARSTSDRTSNLFDMYFTPVVAGYHLTKTDHVALSFSFWAPTGQYEANALTIRA